MKRRAILAGLLALGARRPGGVAGQLRGRSAGDRDHPGEAFTDPPVTRSVASIAASQRYLDRHPEIERRAEREAAAEEAAREQAGEAERGARRRGRGAARRARRPTAEEAGGERPLAAAPGTRRWRPTSARSRSPARRAGPRRQAGACPAQPRIGTPAIGPKSSLSAGTSFLGADSNDSGFIPPDSMGAVGPTQVLVFVNGHFRLFDKQGNPEPTSTSPTPPSGTRCCRRRASRPTPGSSTTASPSAGSSPRSTPRTRTTGSCSPSATGRRSPTRPASTFFSFDGAVRRFGGHAALRRLPAAGRRRRTRSTSASTSSPRAAARSRGPAST